MNEDQLRDDMEKTLYVLDYITDFLAVRNAYPYLVRMYNERLLDSGVYDRLRVFVGKAASGPDNIIARARLTLPTPADEL